MTVVNIKELNEEFVIHFGSEQRTINAYTLATTLVSLADAVKEANSIVNPGYSVEVVVEAMGTGSFKTRIRTVYSGLGNLFSKQNLKAIGLGIISAYIYQQTLGPDNSVNVTIDETQVKIEQGDKTIIIPREIHDALKEVEKSSRFREKVGDAFDSVEKDEKVRSLGLSRYMEDLGPIIDIPRDRFGLIRRECDTSDLTREVEEIADLQIIRAILERTRRRWEFAWRGIKISAPVTDENFYADFFAHKITIAPGDALQVRMRIVQSKDPDTGIYTNNQYEIVEVLKHVPRFKQQSVDI